MSYLILDDGQRFETIEEAQTWADQNKPSGVPVYISASEPAFGAVAEVEYWPSGQPADPSADRPEAR